ncbi:MAG: hypothetical protein ACRD4A_02035 [Candidatus Acidiferrales bacterium]
MKSQATILLTIAVGVLCLLAYFQATTLRQQRRQVQELTAKLESVQKFAGLQLQEKCAKQAREFLSQFENRDIVEMLNHFNARLNKCFVETRSVSFTYGRQSASKVLTDAFEGKDYGGYIFVSTPNKADYLGSPVECKVTLPSGDETICHSEDEFDALVKQYME